jgi:hypothetical protein
MLRQYYWSCDSFSANVQSAANKRNPQKLLIGATDSLRFAYWSGEGATLRLSAQGAM